METLFDKMPANLSRLPEIAYNLWWSWTPPARALFRRLDRSLWQKTQHNPVKLLHMITSERLENAGNDPAIRRQYDKVCLLLDKELDPSDSWFHQNYPDEKEKMIAYFSFEFGIHNSLPIYSGGLGILSGDHAKEASDMGIPLVGVGFMYPQGYFRQNLPAHGWQEAVYEQLNMDEAPIQLLRDADGKLVKVKVFIGDHNISAQVWQMNVGRVTLYLLDTDMEDNNPWDRGLSARLYAGDSEMRLRQEIMLGIGGVRLLRYLDIHPTIWHMNEGHSAFLMLECLREKMREGASFEEAKSAIKAQSVFTTHTPVPAGHDAFGFHAVEQYLGYLWRDLNLSHEDILSLGEYEESWGTAFNMTVLALRLAGRANGVSKLHGEVSREMWRPVWQNRPADQLPISHVTNGVHVPTWIAGEMSEVYNTYLGVNWRQVQDDLAVWQRIKDVQADQLWHTHVVLKQKLLHFLRERTRTKWLNGEHDAVQVLSSGQLLDPNALTLGFARRFATYKRANLIFRDIERLQQLLLDVHRPVQLIFAGKAHPADDGGKLLIQEIYKLTQNHQLGGRVAFVEDYDMHVARYLTQGVDVWLNTPRRPHEASGTSGMKASLNGIPNLSVLDGWWVEGYNGANGWAIGSGATTQNEEEQDRQDAISLYQILEDEVVPLFYNRDTDNVPRDWVKMMKEAIYTTAPQFSMKRMLVDYVEQLYVPAIRREPTD